MTAVYMPPTPSGISGDALLAVTGIKHVIEHNPRRITMADKDRAEMLPREVRRAVRRFLDDEQGLPKRVPHRAAFDYRWALNHLSVALESKHAEAVAEMFKQGDNELAVQYIASARRCVEYLQGKLPIRTEQTMAQTVNVDPSDTEIARFRRAFEIADDPMIILSDMEYGILVPDQVDHLEALYPEGYAGMKKAFANGMGEALSRKKSWKLSWRRDRMVQILFKTSIFSPQLAADLQKNFQTQPQPSKTGAPGKVTNKTAAAVQSKTQAVSEGAV